MADARPSPLDDKLRPHAGEVPIPPSWAAQAASILPWLQRALFTGFGDPTAYQKFKHPGADVQIPPSDPRQSARAALLGQMK